MKRILTFSLCIIILLSCIVIPTFAEEATPEQQSSESPSYNKDELLSLITSDYSDAATYPFAIFTTNDSGKTYAFKTACKYWQKKTTATTDIDFVSVWLRKNTYLTQDCDVLVLLRTEEYTSTQDSDQWVRSFNWNFKSLTVDLCNHTFNLNNDDYNLYLMQCNTNTSVGANLQNYGMNVTLRNGTVIPDENQSLINYIFATGTTHKYYNTNITFDGITVKGLSSGNKLINTSNGVSAYGSAEKCTHSVTFKNCKAMDNNGKITSYAISGITDDTVVADTLSLNFTCEHNDTNNDRACDLCGYYYPVLLSGYSTTLGETLGINFYAQLPASVKAAEVTVAGGEPTVFTVSEMTKLTEGDYAGHYKFSSSVSSVNVREDITIRFLDGDGTAVAIQTTSGTETTESYTTSVFEYANSILNDATYGAAAEALLNYAAYAEAYFGETYAGDRAYNATSLAEVTALEKSAVTGTVSASAGQTILGKVQLDLDNQTTIRIYIEGEVIDEIGGTDAAQVTKCSGYIEIRGIDAKNLNKAYTFTVNGVSVAISATGVAQYVVNTSTNQDAVNLMKALYLFSEAVKAL